MCEGGRGQKMGQGVRREANEARQGGEDGRQGGERAHAPVVREQPAGPARPGRRGAPLT